MQSRFGANAWECLHQEVRCAHPGLDGAEGMLDRLAGPAHGLSVGVEPCLRRFEHLLVVEITSIDLKYALTNGAAWLLTLSSFNR